MAGIKLTATHGAIMRIVLLAAGAGLGLSACASVAPMPGGLASVGPSTPAMQRSPAQAGPRYKLGAPYQAAGIWYVPAEQPHYDEVGVASWYGDEFNGKPTANGELFDMNGVSAAHATLPLPSIVEVTNLENGKTIQVRLNDRGPFHPGRIIDLSRGAAQQLGFLNKGTAQVRVRFVRIAPLNGVDAPTMTMAANPMQGVLPAQPMPQTSVPAPAPSASYASASTGFAVQAGAFSDRANAERVAARLAPAGSTSITALDRGGGRLYRVTVGSWSKAEDAGAARTRVVALGFAEARVVGGS